LFRKVLVANRGEIALRIVRACRELGLETVGVYSTADADSLVLRHVDQKVCIGPPPAKGSYCNAAAVVEAARATEADAIHPGYGFLSEDPDFAEICAEAGIVFVGSPPAVMAQLADKNVARSLMRAAGLPLLDGGTDVARSAADARTIADAVGYPVIVKAVAGGGGRGMTVVHCAADLAQAFGDTRAAARAAFGDDRVYVERFLERARHVEVQILCDSHGGGIHLGTRDCSVQRRHQKLVEEAPAPELDPDLVADMCDDAVRGALSVGFAGAGTVEFLVDEDQKHYFMEINSRIQVEHPVTEMVTGCDLVHEQFYIAAGLPLRPRPEDVVPRGVAIECRVNVEDPECGFAPTPGRLERFSAPAGPFVRVDTHAYPGYQVSPHYDSLIAKVAVWAPSRAEALSRAERALGEFDVAGPGVRTTIPFVKQVLGDTEFRKGQYSTGLVERLTAH
jgi:acetyl-CoA carboxylase biotin carboxylase subunit